VKEHELTPEKLEAMKRDAFVEGYVTALREFGSGLTPNVTLAHKAYERTKR
jgi:hypothetical protein